MKVKELIKLLQTQNKELDVEVFNDEYGYPEPILSLRTVYLNTQEANKYRLTSAIVLIE